ncbi:SUKH-4 family immunity protein [Kitasatospora sp. NPDC051914]|uniref:SUKH-4 family immunity protein n=1 Tax=Kitasatospora sp. NPDC051914 TaxID=3154945 RepID=UPI003432B342
MLEKNWAFGPGACRPLPDGLVPAGIGNDGARAFLTGMGWPLTEGASGLRTVGPAVEGLRPVGGRPDLWEGLGSFHGSPILLDGRTGEVRHGHRPSEDEEFPLMAGSLDRLLRIVLLHHAALTAPVLLGHHDGDDLERAVAGWVATVDPAAAGGGFWEQRCFVPSLYDLWTDRNSK